MNWDDIPQHRKQDWYQREERGWAPNPQHPHQEGLISQLIGWVIGFAFNLVIDLIIAILWSLPKYLLKSFFRK